MAKVLIAEDDLLISDLLENVVCSAGYEICGVVTTVPEALALAERARPDLAIIDVRLAGGGDGTVIAEQLTRSLRLGILYTTGNADYVLARSAAGHACLTKPYRPADVVRALRVVEQILSTGAPPEPVPRGLILLNQPVRG